MRKEEELKRIKPRIMGTTIGRPFLDKLKVVSRRRGVLIIRNI